VVGGLDRPGDVGLHRDGVGGPGQVIGEVGEGGRLYIVGLGVGGDQRAAGDEAADVGDGDRGDDADDGGHQEHLDQGEALGAGEFLDHLLERLVFHFLFPPPLAGFFFDTHSIRHTGNLNNEPGDTIWVVLAADVRATAR